MGGMEIFFVMLFLSDREAKTGLFPCQLFEDKQLHNKGCAEHHIQLHGSLWAAKVRKGCPVSQTSGHIPIWSICQPW